MAVMSYWFFTRPHRKPVRLPKSLAAFAGVAAGTSWDGNREAQIAFEDRLESLGLKERGDHTERHRGRGGSGGRTHAQLLYSLGLHFTHSPVVGGDEVHLTLAGQALVDQEDALPILRKQIVAHQFPSAYSTSPNVNVDRKFKLRPFVLLLKLLWRPELRGYLTDREIAACLLGEAVSHSDRAAASSAAAILDFRERGLESLPVDFASRMTPAKSRKVKTADDLLNFSLKDVANTATQWLKYTGYASPPTEGEARKVGASAGSIIMRNSNLEEEVREVIELWGTKPLLTAFEQSVGGGMTRPAAAAFQRTYGVTPGGQKDQRTISAVQRRSADDRTLGLVSASLSHLYVDQLITEIDRPLIDAVVNHSGLAERSVEGALEKLITSYEAGVDSFFSGYEQMAFSGTEAAIDFERATANVIHEMLGVESRHVGQQGTVPDIEFWTEEWSGIIDTKASARYDLPQDHQLRMRANYIPRYNGKVQGRPLSCYLYVAGGFGPGLTSKLRSVTENTSVPGSGIAIRAWRLLLKGYRESTATSDQLRELFGVGREISERDVARFLEDGSVHVGDR